MMTQSPDLAGAPEIIEEASFLRDTLQAFRRNNLAMVGLALSLIHI